MRKRVRAWSRAIDKVAGDTRMVMITLTYADVDGWRPNHIRDFLVAYRRSVKGKILAYAWVAELQKRGAVHYHVLLVVRRGVLLPKPDDYWSHGLTRIETARTPFYILKYAGKEYQKSGAFPKGLRMFAVWVSPDLLSYRDYIEFRVSTLPSWLAVIVLTAVELVFPSRVRGGGWLHAGKRYLSPYIVRLGNILPVSA